METVKVAVALALVSLVASQSGKSVLGTVIICAMRLPTAINTSR